jgi:tripartite-type tricarboxylate transporter receptor subunit TctC
MVTAGCRRRRFLRLAGVGVALLALGGQTASSEPARTIKLIVPYPAGGSVDFLSRLLAEYIGSTRGQTVVVENRPGASSVIGAEAVARAVPDGNTLLINSQDLVIAPHMRRLTYDPLTSFEPICHLVSSETVIAVSGVSPYRTLADLIHAANAKPGELTIAGTGPGGVMHIGVEMFKHTAKVDMTYLPYPGAAPEISALLGQHVTSGLVSFPNVSEQLAARTLRALAVFSSRRIGQLPEVPTLAESGFDSYDASTWFGVVAPAKTPQDTISQYVSWFSAALGTAEVRAKLLALGLDPVGTCGKDYGLRLRKYFNAYGRAIREANIKTE